MRRRFVAILMLGAFMTGCMHWAYADSTPAQAFRSGDNIIVETTDGREIGLWDAEIVGDSIVGLGYAVGVPYQDGREKPAESQRSRRTVALRDVSRVMTRQVDGASTSFAAGLGMGLIALAVAFGVAFSGMEWGGQ